MAGSIPEVCVCANPVEATKAIAAKISFVFMQKMVLVIFSPLIYEKLLIESPASGNLTLVGQKGPQSKLHNERGKAVVSGIFRAVHARQIGQDCMRNEALCVILHFLFGRDVKTIGKHINNALKEELDDGIPTVAKFGFNGYFPWIGYVVSYRIVLTSPMNKW